MTDGRSLTYEELIGHLRELNRRVVALEMRDANRNLIARSEGELSDLEIGPDEFSFTVGAEDPPEGFVVASWLAFALERQQVISAADSSQGVGPTVVLTIELPGGFLLLVWPAMPLGQQWTDMHTENR